MNDEISWLTSSCNIAGLTMTEEEDIRNSSWGLDDPFRCRRQG